MENSVSEIEAQLSFRSPPRRRRSTFFERRESLVTQGLLKNVDSDGCNMLRDTEEKPSQDLVKYHDTLLAEKEHWKKEVHNRQNKYHDLRQQYQMAAKAPSRSRISYSVLSNDDIEFLKAKVNISKLVNSQQKLHKSVKETHLLFRRVNELDDVIITYCEDKVNKVTNYILENSTIEAKE